LDFDKFPKSEKTTISWRTVLNIIFKRLSIAQSEITPITLQLKDGFQIKLNGTQIILTEHAIKNQKILLNIASTEVDKKGKKLSFGPLAFEGYLDLPVWQDFDFYVRTADGSLRIKDINVPDVPKGSLRTGFKIQGNDLIIENGKYETLHGLLDINATYRSD